MANILITQVSGDIAAYTLTATARVAGSTGLGVLTQTAGADTPLVVDIVFADAAGDTDNAREADHSDSDAYRVLSAQLTAVKTSTMVIRDPFNLNTNPKRIPGAYVQYTITISNTAGATASAILTTITDTLNANTDIDPDLIINALAYTPESVAGSGFKITVGGTSTRAGFPKYYTTTSSVDGIDFAAGTVTATMATVLPVEAGPGYTVGELKAGESVTLTFNVIIQ